MVQKIVWELKQDEGVTAISTALVNAS